jgi:hypothetical protein
MSGLGFNATLYSQQEARRQKAAQQEAAAAAAAAEPEIDQFLEEIKLATGAVSKEDLFESDLKKALKIKYRNKTLPRFIKLKPFVNDREEYLKTSVIDTTTWEIYYPNPENTSQYIKKQTPGFYNNFEYIMNLYYNLQEKMEAAPELELALAGGRRRYKRTQNKAKSSKKRINKNKRRTRTRSRK